VACVGGIVVSGLYYLAVIPLIPSLVGTHPVLLEAMGGSLPSMIAAGAFARAGRVSLVIALAAPVIGLSAFDPLWWWAGRRYGASVTRALASRDPRAGRGTERGLRLFERYGGWTLVFAYYLPVPNNILYAAAGWARFSFLRFAVLDLIGTMLRIGLIVGLGYALGGAAARTAGLISRYSAVTTAALVAALILVAWWRSRPRRAPRAITVDAASTAPTAQGSSSGGGQAAAVEGGDDGVPVDPRHRDAVADARCSFDMAGKVAAVQEGAVANDPAADVTGR
jgi:membrane protein DedA with SNARE-associated domain